MAKPQRKRTVLLTGTASDSHTWNLVYLQLFLEERGHHVVNLGPCVPEELLVRRCRACTPDLVVISSVNGHGYADGLAAITELRAVPDLAGLPVVIGGKLGLDGRDSDDQVARLRKAGFDAVFDDDDDLLVFEDFLAALAAQQPSAPLWRTV